MADEKSRRLGRGLDALFNAPAAAPPAPVKEGPLREIPVSQISRNPFQPRKTFKPDELHELQESLQSSGLLQPVTVRTSPTGSGFELIAGERRLRAATNLGWSTIAAVVKEIDDQELLTLALIENLQRSDLNAVEEAEGYDRLIQDFGYTQQRVATMVGKDRSTIANSIRILQLPAAVRTLIQSGNLSVGQARPLLGLSSPEAMAGFARQAAELGWSARDIERRVRDASEATSTSRRGRPRKSDDRPAELKAIEQRLRKHLQTDVSIVLKPGNRGTIGIDFYSADDLERVAELIGLTSNPH